MKKKKKMKDMKKDWYWEWFSTIFYDNISTDRQWEGGGK